MAKTPHQAEKRRAPESLFPAACRHYRRNRGYVIRFHRMPQTRDKAQKEQTYRRGSADVSLKRRKHLFYQMVKWLCYHQATL
jgi:hypothetical protein